MTAYYDFLRDDGVEFAEILKKNGVKYSFRMFGDETTQDMSHVFHLNIRTNEDTMRRITSNSHKFA